MREKSAVDPLLDCSFTDLTAFLDNFRHVSTRQADVIFVMAHPSTASGKHTRKIQKSLKEKKSPPSTESFDRGVKRLIRASAQNPNARHDIEDFIDSAEQRTLENARDVWTLLVELLPKLLLERGFEITTLLSRRGNFIILGVSLDTMELLRYAECSAYEVQLEADMLSERLDVFDLPEFSTPGYVPFRSSLREQGLLRLHDEFRNGEECVLRTVDRIRLCLVIIHSILDLATWRRLTLPIECFPAHSYNLLAVLRTTSFNPPWWLPRARQAKNEHLRLHFAYELNRAKKFAIGEAMFEHRDSQAASKKAEKQELARLMDRDAELNRIRNYFGERLAFYFAFLAHCSKHLRLLAVLAVVLHVYEVARAMQADSKPWYRLLGESIIGEKLAPRLRAIFGLFTIVWMASFVAHWCRREVELANRWGCESHLLSSLSYQKHVGNATDKSLSIMAEHESLRKRMDAGSPKVEPAFRRHSAINKHARERQRLFRRQFWGRLLSWTCSTLYIGCVIFSTVLILRWRRQIQANKQNSTAESFFTPLMWTSLALSLQMQVYTRIWPYLSKPLTELEAHRFEKDFIASHGVKNTAVDFVSAFAALFYDAFAKPPDQSDVTTIEGGRIHTELDLLARDITCLFVCYYLGGLLDIVIPCVSAKVRMAVKARKTSEERSAYEACRSELLLIQAKFDAYGSDVESYDYEEILFPLMFVGFFSIPMPLASVLALCIVETQAVVDRAKLMYAYRRPYPDAAQGIGVWQKQLLTSICYCAAFTNLGLIIFGLDVLPSRFQKGFHQWVAFFVGEQLFVAIACFIRTVIYREPWFITEERQRQRAQRVKALALHGGPDFARVTS